MKDIRGTEIQVGDTIAYGTVSNYDPLQIGTVLAIEPKLKVMVTIPEKIEREWYKPKPSFPWPRRSVVIDRPA